MPLQTNNLIMAGLRGAIGKQVVFRQRNGKTFVSAYPDMSERVLSPKQLKVNAVMKEASKYAKAIIADEAKRQAAQLRFDVSSTKLYTSLVREYFQQNYIKETESDVKQ